jgi:hypothetical protein
MKKMSLLLSLVLSVAVWAQDQPAPAANPPQSFATNRTEHQLAPTYSDIYCAGFVSKENIPMTNHVLGGLASPHATKFVVHDTLYLAGSDYAIGNRYSVLRKVFDPNRQEMFPGQHKLLQSSGTEYAELGRVTVTRIEKNVTIAEVEFSCQPLMQGDFLVPFQEKPAVQFRSTKQKFEPFAPFSGTAGRIIDGKEFDQVLGTGAKVYVNIGTNKGLKPGDYLRVTRNYDPKQMDPIDRLSVIPPSRDDTVKNGPIVKSDDLKKLPSHGVGELIVLSVTPETATAMITYALEDIQVGDLVEVPARDSQQ